MFGFTPAVVVFSVAPTVVKFGWFAAFTASSRNCTNVPSHGSENRLCIAALKFNRAGSRMPPTLSGVVRASHAWRLW